jgi:hypothetical protein
MLLEKPFIWFPREHKPSPLLFVTIYVSIATLRCRSYVPIRHGLNQYILTPCCVFQGLWRALVPRSGLSKWLINMYPVPTNAIYGIAQRSAI